MSRMNKQDLHKHSIRDKELRKRLGIESLSENLGPMHMKWTEKVANLPATLDGNQPPCKLLGAWIFGGKKRRDQLEI